MGESINDNGTIFDLPQAALLPCGHAAELDDDHYVTDHCYECGWKTLYRALSDEINAAAADRGMAETELIKVAHNIHRPPKIEDMNKLHDRAMRVKLRLDREEALRGKLTTLVAEEEQDDID